MTLVIDSQGVTGLDRARELDDLHAALRPRRYSSLVLQWAKRFARPMRAASREPIPRIRPGQLGLTFGGHATMLMRYAGVSIVADPMFGGWIGGIRRAMQPGLTATDLADVGLVLISHRHADHMHAKSLAHVPRTATVVVPTGAAAAVSPLGFARVVELGAGSDFEWRGVQVIATPVRHGDDPLARGLSYVIRGDGPSAFFCGDSGYFSGFAAVGEAYAPDLALLPIGGYWPRGLRAQHMSPLDALYAFEDLRSRLLIPIHYGAFPLSYELLDEPERWLRELAEERELQDHVRIMRVGQSELFVEANRRYA